MSSLDVRNNSAVMKRAEQLKRWEESDTNREPPTPRPEKGRRIKFSSGCVFLAACLAGDKEEVVKLLDSGADINTANVDGLTALHQACIDDNLEMVEFLVEHGADINRQDNEGWTPLHATASCGFVSIARYLVEHGADVAAVNSDGDLAVDLAVDIQHVDMIDFMQKMVAEHNIDCEKARQAEEQQMLNDAKRWLRSDASEVDRPHGKTGATALHVAAAKGYTKVLSLLLAGRANVDKQDNDGWTPLHAAAHWGQKEAAEMLVDAMADMDVRNYAGQTCIDVAERKMVKFLEELRANNKRIKRRPSSQISSSRISDTIENHLENASTKIIRVEVRPDQTTKEQTNDEKSKSASETLSSQSQQTNKETNIIEDEAPWRRNNLLGRTRTAPENRIKNQVPDDDVKNNVTSNVESSDVILRRTQSFENDEKFYQKYNELRARIKANSCPILPASLTNNNPSVLGTVNTTIQNYSVQRSASLKDHRNFRKPGTPAAAVTTTPVSTVTTTTTTITTTTTTPNSTPVRRSFVPPVRDEESETQRKAHAKRVRETRRSTQGVTLDEIKSAEELVKKKNSTINNNNSNNDTQTSTITTSQVQHAHESPTSPIKSLATTTTTATTTDTDTTAREWTLTAAPTSTSETETEPTTNRLEETIDNDDDDGDDITSTFTIVTPFAKQKTPTNTEHAHTEEISATFTMTTRHESRTPTPTRDRDTMADTTILVTPPEITVDEPAEEHNIAQTGEEKTENIQVSEDEKMEIEKEEEDEEEEDDDDDDDEEEEEEDEKAEDEREHQDDEEVETIEQIQQSTNLSPKRNSTSPSSAPLLAVAQDIPTKQTETLPILADESAIVSAVRNTDSLKESADKSAAKSSAFAAQQRQIPAQHTERYSETTTTNTTTSISIPPALLDSPVRMREKRAAVFDVDSVNSLTLAEKLRNEANKYSSEDRSLTANSDPAASDSDRDSVFSNYSRRSLDSSPLHISGGGGGVGSGCGAGASSAERRPSWRLKFDAGCKFKLEDASSGTTFPATNSTIIPSAPAVIAAANLSSSASQRRISSTGNAINASTQSLNSIGRPVSAPTAISSSVAANIGDTLSNDRVGESSNSISTYATRRFNPTATTIAPTVSTTSSLTSTNASTATNTSSAARSGEDKENEKENDNRSSAATQAVLQRRRKPKRRSTGVVHLDMDDLDPERQETNTENEEKESGSERTTRSRLGGSATDDSKSLDRPENGGDVIDYKALWEAVKLENEKLKQQLKKKDDEVVQSRATLEKITNAQLEVYKTENQRLKEENGALIRVISKLSK